MSAEAPWLDAPVVDEDPEPWKKAPIVEDKEQPWLSAPIVEDAPTSETQPAGHPDRYEELGTTEARQRAVANRSPELQERMAQSEADKAKGQAGMEFLGLKGSILDHTPESITQLTSGMRPESEIERIAASGINPGRINLDAFKVPEGAKTQEDFRAGVSDDVHRAPIVQLPTFADPTIAGGVANAVSNFASGLTSPENLALLAPLARAPRLIQQGAALGFGGVMLKDAYDQLANAPEGETPGQKTERIATAALSLLMAGLSAKHGVDGRTPISAAERAASMERARERVASERPIAEPAGAESARTPAGEAPSADHPVGTQITSDWGTYEKRPNGEWREVDKRGYIMSDTRIVGTPKGEVTYRPASAKPAEAATPDQSAPAPALRPQTDLTSPVSSADVTKPDLAESTYTGGPGAMGPVEAAEMRQRTTGVKNAQVEAERIMRGEDPMTKEEPLANRQAIAEAVETIGRDPTRPDVILEQLANSTRSSRNISVADQAVLMAHKADLMRERRIQDEIYSDGNRTPEELTVASRRLTEIEQRMNTIDQATEAMGTEGGRFLQLRQRLLREDYSLENMERRARVKKGDALTPEETAKIKQQSEELTKLNDELAKVQAAKADAVVDSEVSRTVEATKKEVEKAGRVDPETQRPYDSRILQIAENIVSGLERQAESALARIRARRAEGRLNALPVTDLLDYSIVGAAKMARTGLDFTRWSAEMVKSIGEMSEEVLKEVWDASQKRIDDLGAKAGKDSEKVKGVLKRKGEQTTTQVAAKAKAEAVAGEELSHHTVYEYVRALIKEGVHGENQLMKAAHEGLKQHFPNITERDVRRAYSEYGKEKYPSKEATAVEMAELRTLTRLQESIDRLNEGLDEMKTGLQRDKATQKIRDKTKQLNELLRKREGPPSPEKLTSRDEAKQTALRNHIEDLDRQLRTGEKPPGRTPAEDSIATEQLRAERDAMRAKLQEIQEAQKEVPNPAEIQVRNLEKSLSDLSDRMSGKKEATPPKEWEALSHRAEDLQAEIIAMRQLAAEQRRAETPRKTAEEKQMDGLAKTKERLDEMLAGKRPANAPKDWTPLTEAAADMKAEILAMQELAAQLRRDAKPKSDPNAAKEAAQIKAFEKSIKHYEEKLAARDFSRKGKTHGPDTAKVAALRDIRDARLDVYLAAKKAGKPVRSKEEIALQAYKKRTARKIPELEERMAKGDFAPRPKPAPLKLDREALDLKVKIEKIKEEFNEGVLKMQLAKRSIPQKIIGTAAEVLNTTRAIITSIDFSAVGRQGGFIGLGNPVRAARAIPDMVRAFFSKDAQKRSSEQIKARPNYDLYEKTKLYLSDLGTNSLSKMEEAYMSRWAKNIPLVAGSERAYITYLNRLRADSFDAMVNSLGGRNGVSLNEAKVIANFINEATGRGKLPSKLDASAAGLATVFFSPRYVASRFNLMFQPLIGLRFGEGATTRTRGLIAKEYAKFLTGVAVVYALGQAAGATVETDPRSSDFGKLKFGNTRIDPMGGILQNTVLLTRLATGEKKTTTGKVHPIRGDNVPYGGETVDETLARFTRSKFSPLIGAGVDLASGKNVMGQPVTPAQVAANMVIPMSLRDVYDTMVEQGVPKGTAITLVNMFGFGAQTYDDAKK